MQSKLRGGIGAVLACLALGAPAVYAVDGDAQRGSSKAETCLGCHAIPSYKNTYPMYNVPKVGGQNQAYLVAALTAYRSGQREHLTMNANAGALSDQDIADIAAFFSSLGK